MYQKITFESSLSRDILDAIESINMGAYSKLVMVFEEENVSSRWFWLFWLALGQSLIVGINFSKYMPIERLVQLWFRFLSPDTSHLEWSNGPIRLYWKAFWIGSKFFSNNDGNIWLRCIFTTQEICTFTSVEKFPEPISQTLSKLTNANEVLTWDKGPILRLML